MREADQRDLDAAEKELMYSLEKAYELYHFLLLLMIELTNAQQSRIDIAKNKYILSDKDTNPNTRLINNRFIAQLKSNNQFNQYISDRKISWVNDADFVRSLLDSILNSEIYAEYLASPEDSYEVDKEFWRKVLKTFIVENEDLREVLEQQSLYWNDDLEIVSTFVIKTVKRFDQSNGDDQELLPMFKDAEDLEYAKTLFLQSVIKADRNKELINQTSKNWEMDRVALMDIVIMLVALAEAETFPAIPLRVTLNEYIEIAKAYSTSKSGHFINGILDSIMSKLKKDGQLTKE